MPPVLQTYRSPRGFLVVPVHYTHDPAKRSPEWRAKERAKYQRPEEWAQEMEIDFSAWTGMPAYPNYSRRLHLLKGDAGYDPTLPLCLAMDFNVSPMIWEVCQIRRGELFVMDEITVAPATIEKSCTEFRNRYPDHRGELWIYGDASGSSRTPQTGETDYDLVRLYLRSYPCDLTFKVPLANPPVKDRLNAVNRKLKGEDGKVGVWVSEKCPELLSDFEEVSLRQSKTGNVDIRKVNDPHDPYHRRTHASDAVGYLIYREWPVNLEAMRSGDNTPRPPLKYGRVLGAFS